MLSELLCVVCRMLCVVCSVYVQCTVVCCMLSVLSCVVYCMLSVLLCVVCCVLYAQCTSMCCSRLHGDVLQRVVRQVRDAPAVRLLSELGLELGLP